jgi:PEP-CTERM motif
VENDMEKELIMKHNALVAIFVLGCAVTFIGRAQADNIQFAYEGDGVTVNGTLFGANNGNGTWTITNITGTYNGIGITGLVPLGADPSYIYNNLFYSPADGSYVDDSGILFNVPGIGDVNLYFDPTLGYLSSTGNVSSGFVTTAVTVDFSAPAPEPGTLALLGTAILGSWGMIRRRGLRLARNIGS